MSRPKLAIVTEGTFEKGMGHVFRSIALAQHLAREFEISILLPENSRAALPILDQAGIANDLIPAPNLDKENFAVLKAKLSLYDGIISDTYSFNIDQQCLVKDLGLPLACIDDIMSTSYRCDLILNHSPHVTPADYEIVGPKPLFCLGLDYALLRPEFLKAIPDRRFTKRSKIIVAMGGTDHVQAGFFALKTIADLNLADADVSYLTTSANVHLKKVRTFCESVSSTSRRFSVSADLSPSEVRDLMLEATLMISAPSTTALEGICLRLPLICIVTADNQLQIGRTLDTFGAARTIGEFGHFSAQDLREAIRNIFALEDLSLHMVERQSLLIDGKSGQRILEAFQKIFRVKQ